MGRSSSLILVILVLISAIAAPQHAALAQQTADSDHSTSTAALAPPVTQATARAPLRAELHLVVHGTDSAVIAAEIGRRLDAALARIRRYDAVVVETGNYAIGRDPSTELWRGSQTVRLSSADFGAILSLVDELMTNVAGDIVLAPANSY
jgi:predicted secreted protein